MVHMCRFQLRWFPVVALLAFTSSGASPTSPERSRDAALYLNDGDYFAGELVDAELGDFIRWQAFGMARPFEFPLTAIRAAYFPAAPESDSMKAEYCCELSGGDVLFGSLVSLDDRTVEIDSARFGRIKVARDQVCRLMPWNDSTAWQYRGPNGTTDWKLSYTGDLPEPDVSALAEAHNDKPAPDQAWREEAGHLITSTSGASLRRELPIPRQACIELAISWQESPNFVVQFAPEKVPRSDSQGFRFEVWNQTLVAIRETEYEADVAEICDLSRVNNRIQLLAYFNGALGAISVHAVDGTRLAEVSVAGDTPLDLQSVAMIHRGGDLRFEEIRIGSWNGVLPSQVDLDRPHVRRTDGALTFGRVIEFHKESRTFNVDDGMQQIRIDASEVSGIVLTPGAKPTPSPIRATLHDGTRLSGKLVRVREGRLDLARAGIDGTLRIAVSDLRSLVALAARDERRDSPAPTGRLEVAGTSSRGMLVDGASDSEMSCLVWQPQWSGTASPLSASVAGRIVYRDPPAPATETRHLRQVAQARPAGVLNALISAFARSSVAPSTAASTDHRHTLHMIAGDRVPCEVTRIDDEGVHFTSKIVDSQVVPHGQIKALELRRNSAQAALDETKRTRLLTVPRMQKNNPPTHLLCSVSGDYLRGQLRSMGPETLTLETRLEEKQIPRERIASIVWLDEPEALDDPADAAPALDTTGQVQAIGADGVRLTFVPAQCAKNMLSGTSPWLGACGVDLTKVDQLLIGSAIVRQGDEAEYHPWQLHAAAGPRLIGEHESGAAEDSPGVALARVGKGAPDFRLELIDGGQFRLSEAQGHVVVLDFWASWCGPCMRGMPGLHRLVDEFAPHGVELVAVNIQEDRETIKSALERLGIAPKVVLDIDGAAAEKYEVTAIPQTVVIDAKGVIAGFYIGTDGLNQERLRQVLRALVEADPKATEGRDMP